MSKCPTYPVQKAYKHFNGYSVCSASHVSTQAHTEEDSSASFLSSTPSFVIFLIKSSSDLIVPLLHFNQTTCYILAFMPNWYVLSFLERASSSPFAYFPSCAEGSSESKLLAKIWPKVYLEELKLSSYIFVLGF
jgi:hypothetical protein